MGVKRYILFSVVLVVALGLYVYSFQGGSYMLEFFGIPITLPIAAWVILPVVLVIIFSAIHMMYYSMRVFMANRALGKDYETFIESSKAILLGEKFQPKFKTEWFKLPNEMLTAIASPKDGVQKLNNEPLRDICSNIVHIKDGEYIDIKQYKLSKENPLILKNRLNELNSNPKIASDILRSCSDLESPLCAKAFELLLQNASYTEIRKFNFPLNAKHLLILLKRYEDVEDDIYMNEDDVGALMAKVPMSKDEYVEAARLLKRKMNPDNLVAIFDEIYNNNSEAGKGYLYVLFELQMLDRAREILQNSEEEEFKEFRAYLFLRDNGQNTDLKLLL